MSTTLLGTVFVIAGIALWIIGTTASPDKLEPPQSLEVKKHHIVLKKHKKIGTADVWRGNSANTRIQINEYLNDFMEVEIQGPDFSLSTALYGKVEQLTLEVGKNDAYLLNSGSYTAAAYVHGVTFRDVKEIYSFEPYKSKLERALK